MRHANKKLFTALFTLAALLCMALMATSALAEIPAPEYVMEITSNKGEIQHKKDFNGGWNTAVSQDADEYPLTVKLLKDWEATGGSFGTGVGFGTAGTDGANTGNIRVSGNADIILDLNGCKIDRKLAAAVENGFVIKIATGGTLTITDSKKAGGTITGGKNTGNGGGVYNEGTLTIKGGTISGNTAIDNSNGGGVYNKGTFTMEGGTISGNSTTNHDALGGGGGVYNNDEFTMTGGTISGNTANGNNGGGVYVGGDSEFTMAGGTISDNASNGSGGGVYYAGEAFNVSGKAVVSGNKAGATDPKSDSNVYLNNAGVITIIGALTAGADIGVSVSSLPGKGQTLAIAKNETAEDQGIYFYNDAGYAVEDGYVDSNAYVLIRDAPSINPRGGAVQAAQKITLLYPGEGLIRYTTDGSTPTSLSAEYKDGEPFTLPKFPCTVRAAVFDGESIKSDVSEADFTQAMNVATVTLDPCGGTVSPTTVTATNGALGSLPTPSKSGWDFAGWYTELSGGTQVFITTPINSDCTLYAHWTAAGTAPSGGSGTIVSGITAKSGVAIPITGGGQRLTTTVDIQSGVAVISEPNAEGLKLALDAASQKNKNISLNLNAIADNIDAVQLPGSIISGVADASNNVSGLSVTMPDSTGIIFDKKSAQSLAVKGDIKITASYGDPSSRNWDKGFIAYGNAAGYLAGNGDELGAGDTGVPVRYAANAFGVENSSALFAKNTVFGVKQTFTLGISRIDGTAITSLDGGTLEAALRPIEFTYADPYSDRKQTNISADFKWNASGALLQEDTKEKILSRKVYFGGEALSPEQAKLKINGNLAAFSGSKDVNLTPEFTQALMKQNDLTQAEAEAKGQLFVEDLPAGDLLTQEEALAKLYQAATGKLTVKLSFVTDDITSMRFIAQRLGGEDMLWIPGTDAIEIEK